jgi:Family of unknown function (DUF6788)
MKTTSADYSRLDSRRQALLQQLADLRELRRGSLSEQFSYVKHADGSAVKRGPYPLFTRKEGRTTISKRLGDPGVVPLYRQQIQALRQFETGVDQLVGVGEQLKPSGMHRSVRGANAILALWCCILRGHFEEFWASRNS